MQELNGDIVWVNTASKTLSQCSVACAATAPRKSLCDNRQQPIELDPVLTFWVYLAVSTLLSIINCKYPSGYIWLKVPFWVYLSVSTLLGIFGCKYTINGSQIIIRYYLVTQLGTCNCTIDTIPFSILCCYVGIL